MENEKKRERKVRKNLLISSKHNVAIAVSHTRPLSVCLGISFHEEIAEFACAVLKWNKSGCFKFCRETESTFIYSMPETGSNHTPLPQCSRIKCLRLSNVRYLQLDLRSLLVLTPKWSCGYSPSHTTKPQGIPKMDVQKELNFFPTLDLSMDRKVLSSYN